MSKWSAAEDSTREEENQASVLFAFGGGHCAKGNQAFVLLAIGGALCTDPSPTAISPLYEAPVLDPAITVVIGHAFLRPLGEVKKEVAEGGNLTDK